MLSISSFSIDNKKEVKNNKKEVKNNKKEVINDEKEVINDEKEVINDEKEVKNNKKEVKNNKKEVKNNKKEVKNNKKEVINNEKEVKNNKKEVKNNKKEVKNNKKEVINNEKEVINYEKEVINDEKEVINNEKEVINDEKAVINDEKAVINDEKAVINDEKEVINDEKAVINDEKAVINDEKKVINNEKELINDEKEVINNETEVTNDKKKIRNNENEDDNEIDDITEKLDNIIIDKKQKKIKSIKNVKNNKKPIIIELFNNDKVQQFKIIFQNIKILSKFINININNDELNIKFMDDNKISFIEINLPSIWFDNWIVPIKCVIGISIELLYNILNLSENSISIEYDPYIETDKLSIELIMNKYRITYDLPLIDIEEESLLIPEIEYMVDLKMKSNFFFNILDKLKKFGGDNIIIEFNEENIKLIVNTIEAGEMIVLIEIDDLIEYGYGISEEKNKGEFVISYIYNISLFYKITHDIEINFLNEQPLKIKYNILDISQNNHKDNPYIIFYLAPKLSDNDY